jgi:hypothetical protein
MFLSSWAAREVAPESLDPDDPEHGSDEADQHRRSPQIPRGRQCIDPLYQEFLPALDTGDVNAELVNLPERQPFSFFGHARLLTRTPFEIVERSSGDHGWHARELHVKFFDVRPDGCNIATKLVVRIKQR